MQIGMIGLGNMGTAMGNLMAFNGHKVIGWEYQEDVVEDINSNRRNGRYLAGVELNPGLVATRDLASVCGHSDFLFIAIPSLFIHQTLAPQAAGITEDCIIVNMAKGIDKESGMTSYQTIASLLPNQRKVMLSGPSIANEFARGMATVVVIASDNMDDLLPVARLLDNHFYRTRFSTDVIGVELGGILKNIYTIGLGLFDGLDISSVNFRAVYLTIAVEEMARMGESMGAELATFLYLAGIGDLLATSLSEHSHNRKLGHLLAEGHNLEQVKEQMGVLPEGYNTLETTLYIAEKLHVSLPLARGLWDVIHGRSEVNRFITCFIRDFVD